jgi:hypothetical protein
VETEPYLEGQKPPQLTRVGSSVERQQSVDFVPPHPTPLDDLAALQRA